MMNLAFWVVISRGVPSAMQVHPLNLLGTPADSPRPAVSQSFPNFDLCNDESDTSPLNKGTTSWIVIHRICSNRSILRTSPFTDRQYNTTGHSSNPVNQLREVVPSSTREVGRTRAYLPLHAIRWRNYKSKQRMLRSSDSAQVRLT
jgi:hypothetical protein